MSIRRHRVTAGDMDELTPVLFPLLQKAYRGKKSVPVGTVRIPTPEGLLPIPIIAQYNAPEGDEGEYDPRKREVHLNALYILTRHINYWVTIEHELDHARHYAFRKSWKTFVDYDEQERGDSEATKGSMRLQRAIFRALRQERLLPFPYPEGADSMHKRARVLSRFLIDMKALAPVFEKLGIREDERRAILYELLLTEGFAAIVGRGLSEKKRYLREPDELHAFANTIYNEIALVLGKCAPRHDGKCVSALLERHSPSYRMIRAHISDEQDAFLLREVGKAIAKMLQTKMV